MILKMSNEKDYNVIDWAKINKLHNQSKEVKYTGNKMSDDNNDVYATFEIDSILYAVRID